MKNRSNLFEQAADLWCIRYLCINFDCKSFFDLIFRRDIYFSRKFSYSLITLVVWILKAKPVIAFLDNEVIDMILGSLKNCQTVVDSLDYIVLELLVALDRSKWAFLFLFLCLVKLWLRLHITFR